MEIITNFEIEIVARAKMLHEQLTEAYYERKLLTKWDFDQQHGHIWGNMEAELIAGGFRPALVDFRKLYQAAISDKARVVVIAKKLGLL